MIGAPDAEADTVVADGFDGTALGAGIPARVPATLSMVGKRHVRRRRIRQQLEHGPFLAAFDAGI